MFEAKETKEFLSNLDTSIHTEKKAETRKALPPMMPRPARDNSKLKTMDGAALIKMYNSIDFDIKQDLNKSFLSNIKM